MKRNKTAFKALALLGAVAVPAQAQQLTNQDFQTNVNVAVLPIAELTIQGDDLLYLLVPPSGSTIPSSGVEFLVTGNADATLVAEPDAFIEVAGQHLGKAVRGTEAVGYNVELQFPDSGVPGSPPQLASLPEFEEGPTVPALTVDLTTTAQERTGVIHLVADPNWTTHGGIPLPGLYVGAVTLTLTPSD